MNIPESSNAIDNERDSDQEKYDDEELEQMDVDDEPDGLDQKFNGVTNQELEDEPQQESESKSEYQSSNEELGQGLEEDLDEEREQIKEQSVHKHLNGNKILGICRCKEILNLTFENFRIERRNQRCKCQ